MKKTRLWIVLGATAAVLIAAAIGYHYLAPRSAPEAEGALQSEPAADFTVTDAHGASSSLSAHRGKPVVVNFWASWCPPCRTELPAFQAAYEAYGDRIDFMMVALTDGQRETVETARRFIAEQGYAFPLYFDTAQSAAVAYQLRSIPVTLFIRADGTLAYTQIGGMQAAALEERIKLITE